MAGGRKCCWGPGSGSAVTLATRMLTLEHGPVHHLLLWFIPSLSSESDNNGEWDHHCIVSVLEWWRPLALRCNDVTWKSFLLVLLWHFVDNTVYCSFYWRHSCSDLFRCLGKISIWQFLAALNFKIREAFHECPFVKIWIFKKISHFKYNACNSPRKRLCMKSFGSQPITVKWYNPYFRNTQFEGTFIVTLQHKMKANAKPVPVNSKTVKPLSLNLCSPSWSRWWLGTPGQWPPPGRRGCSQGGCLAQS